MIGEGDGGDEVGGVGGADEVGIIAEPLVGGAGGGDQFDGEGGAAAFGGVDIGGLGFDLGRSDEFEEEVIDIRRCPAYSGSC